MFDLAWSEIALIGVVALVVIGPKDLPEAIRGVARGVQKLKRMAAEFQGQADELVREAKLDEVRNQINEVRSAVNDIRNFDLRTEIEKNIDADGTIRSSFHDPLKSGQDWANPPPVIPAAAPDAADMEGATAGMMPSASPAAPAFVPPAFVPPGAAAPAAPPPVPVPVWPPAPAAAPDADAAAAPLPPQPASAPAAPERAMASLPATSDPTKS